MKRDDFNSNDYNHRLLTILIAFTVVICVVLASVAIFSSKKDEDVVEKNSPVDTLAKELENDKEEAEISQPDENEILIQEDPETTEEPEIPEVSANNDSDWMLILANPWNSIPEDFTVELEEIGGGHKVDKRIVGDLNQMMSDLRSAGHSAFVCSSYRTNAKQTSLYNNEINDYLSRGYSQEDAVVEAGKWVAIPGTSEHQTGLAIDIMSSYYMVLDRGQEDTAEQQWLMENSYKYGFILRYPSDKSELTGIYYEPWHYRYVGKDAAKEIYEKGICFEEYIEMIR